MQQLQPMARVINAGTERLPELVPAPGAEGAGKGLWYVCGGNVGCSVLGCKLFRATCLHVWGGGSASGPLCGMGQCYKLTTSAKSLKQEHAGRVLR